MYDCETCMNYKCKCEICSDLIINQDEWYCTRYKKKCEDVDYCKNGCIDNVDYCDEYM